MHIVEQEKNMRNTIIYFIKVGAIGCVVLATLGLIGLLMINRAYAPQYIPYLPQHIALVFDDRQNPDDVEAKLGFVLADIKTIARQTNRFAVIHTGGVNKNADASALSGLANSFYIDIFSNRNATQGATAVFNNTIDLDLPVEIKSYLDRNNNVRVRYDRAARSLQFVFLGQVLTINGETLKLNDYIAHTIADITPDTVATIGDVSLDLEYYQNDYTVTVNDLITHGIGLYKRDGVNIIPERDGSFEDGLWVPEVGDCSAYLPGDPSLGMAWSSDAVSGGRSLQLSSRNHFACTYKSFVASLDGNKRYRLSFAYHNVAGGKVQAYYNLKNEEGKNQDHVELFDAAGPGWQRYSTIITPTIDPISGVDIYFYAPSDGSAEIINRYDSVRFETFSLERKLTVRAADFSANYNLYNWIKLLPGNNVFTYVSDPRNLLADNNPSFEDGPWAPTVQDCSDYLPGSADISMVVRSDAVQGKNSLELSARNHFACAFKTFPVDLEGSRLYRFGFNYKNITGGKVQYYYNLKNNQGQHQDYFQVIDATTTDWQKFETVISPTIDKISSVDVYLYSPSDGSGEVVNRYDNVTLTEYLPKEIYSYYLYAQLADRKPVAAKSIEYRTVDRWTSVAVIHGINKPFVLVYPRAYAAGWALYLFTPSSAEGLRAPDAYYRFSGDTTNRAEKSEVNAYIKDGLLSAVGRQYISKNVDGYIRNDNIPTAPVFTSLLKRPLDAQWHMQVNDKLNGWYIDPATACSDTVTCIKNADGTYTISVLIEHRGYRFTVVALLGAVYALWWIIVTRYYKPRS